MKKAFIFLVVFILFISVAQMSCTTAERINAPSSSDNSLLAKEAPVDTTGGDLVVVLSDPGPNPPFPPPPPPGP